MTHFVLTYGADKDKRLPHFLKGSLTPVKVKKYDQVTRDTLAPYWDEKKSIFKFKNDLFFISRERLVDVDFYPVADGFLASKALVDILLTFASNSVQLTDVEMLNEAGISNSKREMKFCQIIDVKKVCDLSRMDINGAYHKEIDGPNVVEDRNGIKVVTSAAYIILDKNIPNVTRSSDIPSLMALVSQDVRDACTEEGLRGPYFVPVDQVMVVDFMLGSGQSFSKTTPRWQERSVVELWGRKVSRENFFDPHSLGAQKTLESLLKQFDTE